MTDEVVVYIAPPLSDRGLWRVRSDGRQLEEFRTEQEAVGRAAKYARSVESAGGVVVIKVERPDGSWETYRI